MQMRHTRYSTANAVLLAAGAIVCAVVGFMFVMTAGFGADPAHDFKSSATVCLICVGLLSCPVYLLMFRWSAVASIAMRCVTISCFLIALIGRAFSSLGLVVLILIEALICSAIDSRSKEQGT